MTTTVVGKSRFALLAHLVTLGITSWRFLTHPRMHLDEHVLYELVCDVATPVLPGIDKNPIAFNRNGSMYYQGKDAEQLAREGYLIVGRMGSALDEHAHEGQAADRTQSSCSLGLQFLEGYVRAEILDPWRPTVAEATQNDTKGGGRETFTLGTVIKTLYRYNLPVEDVCAWVRVGLHAVRDGNVRRAKGQKVKGINNLLCRGQKLDPADEALALWYRWNYQRKKFFPHDQVKTIADLVTLVKKGKVNGLCYDRLPREQRDMLSVPTNLGGRSLARQILSDLGLEQAQAIAKMADQVFLLKKNATSPGILHFRSILQDMVARGDDAADVLTWAFTAFDARLRENISFTSAMLELQSDWAVSQEVIASGRTLQVLSVVSDNEMIGSASSELSRESGLRRPDVLIQQSKDNGQLRVGFNVGGGHGDLLRAMAPILAANFRLLDCRLRGIDPGDKDLRFEGSSEQMPWWFYLNHDGLVMLLNGSESAPDVEPTRLCIEQVFLCVCDAWKQVCGATS